MTDKQKELSEEVRSSCYQQCQKRGYAAPVDVLMDLGVLTKAKYEDWRFGRVDYLERVCMVNLNKLTFIMKQIRAYAAEQGYRPSVTVYTRWGAKKSNRLRFSKSGNPSIEEHYATHYLDDSRIAALKKAKTDKTAKTASAEAGKMASSEAEAKAVRED